MPRFKTLSSLFQSAAKTTPATAKITTTKAAATATKTKATATATKTKARTTAAKAKAAIDAPLKHYISALDTSSSPSIAHYFTTKTSLKPPKLPAASRKTPPSPVVKSVLSKFDLQDSDSDSEDANYLQLAKNISSILNDDASVVSLDLQQTSMKKSSETGFHIPWFSNLFHENVTLKRKEVCRLRKQTWVHKSTQKNRFNKMIGMMDENLGPEATLDVCSRLGRETGVKEYNALMKICIEKARASDDEDVALERIFIAFELFKKMKEEGFQVAEETYSPFLMYFIDMGMVEEFKFFCQAIEDSDSSSLARLGYYEMLLYIRVNNEKRMQELCSYIAENNVTENFKLRENYLLAFCESGRKNELLQLLEITDITKISSLDHIISIFAALGRLSLESLAKKFLLSFKECDYGSENMSIVIFNYATSIPNLVVEDVILKFKNLHSMLEIAPSSESYKKLVLYNCDLLKVHTALDIVDQMCKEGLTLCIDMFNSILHACDEGLEFSLAQEIYLLICRHNLTPNDETFRSMISLRVKMKDFSGAYDMLDDLKKFNLTPTASMYNAIMAGCFREKNVKGGLMVLKKMEDADLKPDSITYSYLIANCSNEDQISKYHEELKIHGIQVSKQIFMALINAYASCGLFEKAKQVLLDKGIPIKNLNEIRSALVSALASHGQISDAFGAYEEIKEAGHNVEPKAVISLIEHLQAEGGPSRLLELLEELQETDYWVDGCRRVILWFIRNKNLSYAFNLLKQLKDRLSNDELAMQVIFDEFFSLIAEMEPTDLQIGLDLLRVIKDELFIMPSRKSLDFLLSACTMAKDLQNSHFIWKEYQAAGYPYNVLSYLRMYQALLASGNHKSAKAMLAKIPKDDFHVCRVIQACEKTYIQSKGKTKRIEKTSEMNQNLNKKY